MWKPEAVSAALEGREVREGKKRGLARLAGGDMVVDGDGEMVEEKRGRGRGCRDNNMFMKDICYLLSGGLQNKQKRRDRSERWEDCG